MHSVASANSALARTKLRSLPTRRASRFQSGMTSNAGAMSAANSRLTARSDSRTYVAT
ncbi:hypothetical protein D3C74_433770 [compost metagenome]